MGTEEITPAERSRLAALERLQPNELAEYERHCRQTRLGDLAPETNGESAYRAYAAEEKKTGVKLTDLAESTRGVPSQAERGGRDQSGDDLISDIDAPASLVRGPATEDRDSGRTPVPDDRSLSQGRTNTPAW